MIAVSFLKSKFNKEDTIKKIDESTASLIHVDLMDGIYVKNNNLLDCLNGLKNTKKPLDVHLMVSNPLSFIDEVANLNTEIITFHLDSNDNPIEVIKKIKSYNIKIGIALNPKDNVSILDNYYELIDYVLIMSVVPGLGGQEFIPSTIEKIDFLQNKGILLGIDGGINDQTIKYLKKYKIDIIVSGSYVCMSDDFNKQIESLK